MARSQGPRKVRQYSAEFKLNADVSRRVDVHHV